MRWQYDRLRPNSKSECILKLRCQPRPYRAEAEPTAFILQPALIEDYEQVVAWSQNPAHTTLPSQVARFVVKLHEIGDGQERRERVVGVQLKDACHKGAFLEPSKSLIQSQPDLKMRQANDERTERISG